MNSERYADGRSRINIDGQLVYVQWCQRQRCNNKIVLQTPSEEDDEPDRRKWRYPHYAVIVSLEDGTKKLAFCSKRCAINYLQLETRREGQERIRREIEENLDLQDGKSNQELAQEANQRLRREGETNGYV